MGTILIGADICPIEGNQPYFGRGDAKSLFHDLLVEFESADLVLANLECPLTAHTSPILKTGPTFGESPECIRGIKAAGIDVLCLANNHCMDHGPEGLQQTVEVCEEEGIATVGVGKNREAAGRVLVRLVDGVRVGILAYAENEFSIAGKESWGANPLDLIHFVRTVERMRDDIDYLVVLLHGAAEFHVPTPRIQQTCRFMIEQGAHAVVVQHPHVMGGHEAYEGGTIVYGQGALVMDEAVYRSKRSFHEGFLVKLSVNPSSRPEVEFIPFVQSDPVPGARKMVDAEKEQVMRTLSERSERISDPEYVQAQWQLYCRERRRSYLHGLLAHGRLLRTLNRNGYLDRWLFNGRRMVASRNVVCCETHREALETIFDRMFRR